MSTNLDNLFAQDTVDTSGIGKDDTGTVVIQSSDSQPVVIQTSSEATAIQVNDDATVNLNLGVAVNEIVNSFNDGTADKDKKLLTVQANIDYIDSRDLGKKFFDFNSLANYDARVWLETDMPADVYVSDTIPINFTDDYGKSVTGADWIELLLHWNVTVEETHLRASSLEAGQQTDAEIKTAYENNANTNAFNDAYKAQLDNAPININTEITNINTSISGNASSISTNQSNIGSLQSDYASKSTSNIFTKQQKIESSSSAQVSTKNTGASATSAIGHRDSTGNFRAYCGYNDTTDKYFIGIGNQASAPNLGNRLEMTTTEADFLVTLKNNGNAVLTVGDYSVIKSALDALTDTNFLTDSERTKLSNAPTDTTTELALKFNNSGGVISGETTITNSADKKDSIIIQRTSNLLESGIAWQNSGSNKTKAIYQEGNDVGNGQGDLVIAVGNDADVNLLAARFRFTENGFFKVVNGGLHISIGDLFVFDGETALDTLDCVNTALFRSDTTFNNDILTSIQSHVGNYKASHRNDGNNQADFGNKIGTNLTGMRVFDTWDGSSFNEQYISFFTQDGGSSVGERMRIDKSGNVGIGTTNPANKLDVYGNFYLVGNQLCKGNLTLEDTSQKNYTFEQRAAGIGLRAEINPAIGDPILTVESSGNSPRLRVEHNRYLSTSNDDIKVGIEDDGGGGSFVLHENNYGKKMLNPYYHTNFPSLSTTDVAAWTGKEAYLIGTGSGTINLPEIVSSGATSSQINVGESFCIHNFNSSSNMTISPFSGQKQVDGNIAVIRTGNTTLNFDSGRKYTAADMTGHASVNAMAWLVYVL